MIVRAGVRTERGSSFNYLLISFPKKCVFIALLCVFTYILFGKFWAGYIIWINTFILKLLNSSA